MYRLSVILLAYSLILGAQTQNVYEETVRLKRDLFTNHSVDIRPVINRQNAVSLDVKVKVVDASLLDFVLTSRIYLKISWLDHVLQWQSGNYTNITHLHLRETELWTPRFQVWNSVSDGSLECYDKVVKIYNDGMVVFDCRSTFNVRCETAFVRFPFDEHDCEIVLHLADYDKEEVKIRTTTIERLKSQEHQSKSWELKNLLVRPSEFHHSNSAALSVTLHLERNFLFHLAFAIFPVMLVSLLVPLTFLIQDNAFKILFSLLTFLLMMLLVFHILPYLPKTCNCAFNLYIIGCLLFLNFMSTIISVAMYKYNYRNPRLQEAKAPTDENRFQDFVYDFRNPHNFLFNEKMLKKLMNQGCFTCCSPSVDDIFSAEVTTYFKSRAKKKKCSNHKMFIVFMILWSALTALYLVKTFEII